MTQTDSMPSANILPDGSIKTTYFDLRDLKFNYGVEYLEKAVIAMGRSLALVLEEMGILVSIEWEMIDSDDSPTDPTIGFFKVKKITPLESSPDGPL